MPVGCLKHHMPLELPLGCSAFSPLSGSAPGGTDFSIVDRQVEKVELQGNTDPPLQSARPLLFYLKVRTFLVNKYYGVLVL